MLAIIILTFEIMFSLLGKLFFDLCYANHARKNVNRYPSSDTKLLLKFTILFYSVRKCQAAGTQCAEEGEAFSTHL